jgi:hypothetical protein
MSGGPRGEWKVPVAVERRLRLRAVLDRWFGVVVAALLVAGLAGGVVATGALLTPGTQTEERVVYDWSVTTGFSHEATVRADANVTVFEPGESVENRSVYFRRIMPVLDGRFGVEPTRLSVPLDLRIRQTLVVRNVDTDGDGPATVYWSERTPLGKTTKTVRPGESAAAAVRVNVARHASRARNVSERLGAPGRLQMRLLTNVSATRETPGAVTRRLNYTATVDVNGPVYEVSDTGGTENFRETRTETVPSGPEPVPSTVGTLVALVGFGGAGWLVRAHRRDQLALSTAEREWLAYRDDRADYEEWLTTVKLPTEAEWLPVAEAETLADLADLAIDTDNPVVESPDGDAYHVIHDGYHYVFEAPPEPDTDDHGSRTP